MLFNSLATISLFSMAMAQEYTADDLISAIAPPPPANTVSPTSLEWISGVWFDPSNTWVPSSTNSSSAPTPTSWITGVCRERADCTSIATTQTATHCENQTCGTTVVTITTIVPVTHTTTVCPITLHDGKVVTVTVPCEIESSTVTLLNHNITATHTPTTTTMTLHHHSNHTTSNRTATVTPAHHTETTPHQANGAGALVHAGAFLALPVLALMI